MWIDVDDTILDFTGAHPAGVRAVERWAREHTGPDRARRLAATFERGFQLALNGWHGGLPGAQENFQARLTPRLERILGAGPRPTRWGRSSWLELAAEDVGMALPRETLAEGAQQYWRAVAPAQRLYPEVPETLRELRERGYRLALLSSSDCRLVPDPEGWRYDEDAARDWKFLRLRETLRPVMPFVEGLMLGDPYEKTGPEFYRQALERMPVEPGSFVITVGDSVESDVRLARETDPAVRFGCCATRTAATRKRIMRGWTRASTGSRNCSCTPSDRPVRIGPSPGCKPTKGKDIQV